MDTKYFADVAAKVRIDVIRAIYHAGSGHPGGSLSAADIVTALYFKEMNIDPKNPWAVRFRDTRTCTRSRALRCQRAPWARGFPCP